jgi:hypothetical protein
MKKLANGPGYKTGGRKRVAEQNNCPFKDAILVRRADMPHGAKFGGRTKGTPSKISAIIREAIVEAATKEGNGSLVAYLRKQARETPLPSSGCSASSCPRRSPTWTRTTSPSSTPGSSGKSSTRLTTASSHTTMSRIPMFHTSAIPIWHEGPTFAARREFCRGGLPLGFTADPDTISRKRAVLDR